MASYGFPDDPSYRTRSWVKAWWLHSVRGYHVLQVRRQPRKGWFGRVRFAEQYTLLPKSSR